MDAFLVLIPFFLSRSLTFIRFFKIVVIHGDLVRRVRFVFTGACLSQTLKNKSFHFVHMSLGLYSSLMSSHGCAKISLRKLVRLKCLNCL